MFGDFFFEFITEFLIGEDSDGISEEFYGSVSDEQGEEHSYEWIYPSEVEYSYEGEGSYSGEVGPYVAHKMGVFGFEDE